ncbi:MAG: hypothetical protein GY906_07365 [bacterium]|nr:hypothetical protein [bacterium]
MDSFMAHHTILVIMQILAVGLICFLFYLGYQRQLARRHEFSKAFLDKMSSEEFIALLQTSAGRRSVERILGTYKPASEWITDAIRRAVFLAFIGAGCLAVYTVEDFTGAEIFLAIGCLGLGVSLAFLVAAGLTRGRARRENDEAAS